jgi:hypothetical protein
MSKAGTKSSPTDQYASRIARTIAKGRPPPFGDDLDRYCESSPREIFAALAGAARHMPPAGKDGTLATGYLFLLARLLEHLRYRSERGYADAATLIADFQADIVARVEAGALDGRLLAFVGGALHQAQIPASPEFTAASARVGIDHDEDGPVAADIRAALAAVVEGCDGDPFAAAASLMETGHAMPAEVRSALVGALALAGNPQARSVAVLFLLDSDPAVRNAVSKALAQVAGALMPVDVRRLIAIRNWRPESERNEVDAIIRKARESGIACAQWEAGSIDTLLATSIDGAATQGFLLLSPAGRKKKRISSVLTKGGIADAWSGEPESLRSIEASLAGAGLDAPMLVVSRSYLDRIVAHHVALCTENGRAPPFGLLQVAETIGGADWQPLRMDFREALAGLLAEIPSAMREGVAVASLLRTSDELPGLEVVAQCWFEDDPHVAKAVARASGRDHARLVSYLLQSVVARHRDKWADVVLRTALWMREAPANTDACWRELALVANALADGRDPSEIGLMRAIALRTVAALGA